MKDSNNENGARVPDAPPPAENDDPNGRLSIEERDQLLCREQEARLEAEVMRDANLALTQDLSLERILETLLNYLRKLVPFDSANVMLVAGDSCFVTSAIKGYEDFLDDISLAKGNSYSLKTNALLRQICETKQSLLISDTKDEPRWQSAAGSVHIRNWIGVPLFAHDEIMGLYSLDKAQPGFFTAEHVRKAESLAAQAATAIRNAQLFGRVERYAAELEQLVAERRQAEEALRESEQLSRSVFEHIDEIIYMVSTGSEDPAGGIVQFVSGRVEQIIGYKPDEFMNDPELWFNLLHPDDVPGVVDSTRKIFQEKRSLTRVYRVRHKHTGQYHWMEDLVVPRLDYAGAVAATFGVARDITERKQAEQRFRGLLESAPDAMVLTDHDSEIVLVNSQTENLFGYSKAELLGQKIELLIPERFRDEHHWHRAGYLASPKTRPMGAGLELHGVRKDGTEFPVEISLSPLEIAEGRLVISAIRDITERKQAEEARREAEEKYRDIFENAGEGIFQSTPDGRFISANPAFARMHGFDSPEDLIRSWDDISRQTYSDPARREEFKRLLEKNSILRGFEHQVFRKDGGKIWISVNARAVRDEGGAIRYYEGTAQDINERKRAEARSAAFATLARKLSGARTQLDAGRIIAQTAGDLFGWDSCDLNLYDADRDLVYQMLNIDIIDGRQTEVFGVISGRKPTARGRRTIDHGPELLLREEPIQFDADAIPFGDRTRPSASIMAVPIRHADKVIGLLSIQSYTPNSYDTAALDDLQALADHCGAALNRIRAEEGLRESEERYRDLVENSEELICTHDLEGRILSANRAAAVILGYQPKEPSGKKTLRDILAPEVRDQFDDYLARLQEEGFAKGLMLVQTSTGERRIWEYYNSLRTEGVATPIVRGMARDITDRKRAEAALRESEERLRLALDAAHMGTFDWDVPRNRTTWSRWHEELWGFKPGEFGGTYEAFSERVHHDDLPGINADIARCIASREPSVREFRVVWPDGSVHWMQSRGEFTFGDDGQPVRMRGVVVETTARRLAEEALQESEERFRQLSDAAFEAIVLHDQGTILEVNQSFCRMYGYERAEVIGKSVPDLALPGFRELLLQRVRSGDTDSYEGPALRKDGTTFRAEVAGKPIHYQGRVVRVAAIRDITEQKRNERRQAAQYAVTRVLAESATLAEAIPQLLQVICESLRWKMGEFWRVCDSPNLLRCFETWHVSELDATSFIEASRQTELAPGAGLPGRVWQSGQPSWIADVTTDPLFARAAVAAKVGLRGAVAFPILVGNHTLGVMQFFSRRAPEVDDDLLKIMSAIGSQIGQFTERKRAEEALRQSEVYFRSLIEHAADTISTYDANGVRLYTSPSIERVLGYKPEEMIGRSGFELLHPDDLPLLASLFAQAVQIPGTTITKELRCRHKDGTWRTLESTGSNLLGTPAVGAVVLNSRDITERRRAEEALRESEERYRDLVENSHELICTHDLEGKILSANRAATELLGYDPNEFIGKGNIRNILAPEVRHQFDEYMARVCKDGATSGIMLVQTSSGERRVWEYYNSLRTEGVATPIVRGMARDITERKQAEQALRESEERLRLALDAAHMGTFDWDVPRNRITWSRWHEELWGYKPGEFGGTYEEFSERVHPDDLQGINAEVARCIAAHEPFVREFRVVWPDGSVHWVQGRGEFTLGDDGQSVRMRGVVVETTARRLAEEALRTSEERLRVGLNTAKIAVFNQDLDLRYIWMYQPQLGYTSEQVTGHTDAELLPPEAARQIMEIKRRVLESGLKEHAEVPVSVGGQTFVYDLVVEPLRDANSAIIGLTGASLDITERKRAETERDVISEVIQSVNLTSNLDELLKQVHQSLKRVLYSENCCVALFDKQTGLFEGPLFVDLVEANPFPISPSKNCTAKVFSSGQPLLMNEAIFDELLERGEVELIGRPSPSFLAVPLMTPAETIGVIVVQHYEKDNVYSQRDVEFLSAVAAQLALAIERKRAQEALRESEERFRTQYENIPLPTYTWQSVGNDLVLVAYNRAAEEYTRGRIADLIGKSATELYADSPEVMNYLRRCYLEQTAFSKEVLYRLRTSGEERHLRVSHTYVPPDLVMVHTDDITERKQAEAALRESEERYRDLVENSREFICTHDLNGVILSANRAASEVLGYDLKDWCGKKNYRDLLVPEVRDQFDDYLARVRRDGVAIGLTLVQASSGERRILEYHNTLRTEGVATPVVRGMARDVTEQRRAEKTMSDLRRELELMMSSMGEGIHRVDMLGNVAFENPAAARMLGWEVAELLGKPAHLTMHHTRPDGTTYPKEECPIYATLRDGISRHVTDEMFWRRDGTSFPVEYMTAPMRNDRNEIVATVVTFSDTTEQRRAERSLRESEERYRELFENAKDAIYVHDLSGRYTSVNRAAEKLSGFTREEILGKHFSNFVSPRDLKHVRVNLCRKLDEENETIYDVDLVTRTGQRVPVEVSSRLVYENGVAVGVQGVARDITDRKRAQQALRIYSQRLIQAQEAEREKIARELHDQIGQILTAVRINLQSIQRSYGTDENTPRFDESIGIVDEALGRVRELSIELRPSLLDDLGLTAALRWYVDRFAQRTGIIAEMLNGFEEGGRLPRELETVCFRIAQEALTNVARHAQAGSVSVQLERSRERILLTIIDDGVGFDVDKLKKSASAATALGLRGMEERALAVGGYIKIDSGLERGTQIRATFPLKRK